NRRTNWRWNGLRSRALRSRSLRIRKKNSPKSILVIEQRSLRKSCFSKTRFEKRKAPANLKKLNHSRSSLHQKSAACRRTAKRRRKNCAPDLESSAAPLSGERRLPACASRQLAETGKWRRLRNVCPKDVAGRAAGNYRLAACAPQKCTRPHSRSGRYSAKFACS